jgi:hypothetical protein
MHSQTVPLTKMINSTDNYREQTTEDTTMHSQTVLLTKMINSTDNYSADIKRVFQCTHKPIISIHVK